MGMVTMDALSSALAKLSLTLDKFNLTSPHRALHADPQLGLGGGLAALLVAYYVFSKLRHLFGNGKRKRLSLPPGPTPLPIVGNMFDLPPEGIRPPEWWARLKDVYGA